MRRLETPSSSTTGKEHSSWLDRAGPSIFFKRCVRWLRNLKYCYTERVLIHEVMKEKGLMKHALGNRDLVRRALNEQEFVQYALDSKQFLQDCIIYRSALEPFLYGRHCLQKMNVDEGSLYLEDERELVREAVLQANSLPGPIIEVGTLFGYTTSWMAQWKRVDKKIISVDNYCWNPWNVSPDSHRMFTRRVLGYLIHRGEVELIDMDKNAFFESYRGPSPSLVFLDANHSYEETAKDIAWAKRIGAKIIAGHDYVSVFGVVRAVEEAGGRRAGASSVWVLNGSAWKPSAEVTLRLSA
jgi:hypothetical protein